MSKKIVQINMSYGSGSTGKIVKAIHRLLDEEGIENRVYCSAYKPVDEANVYTIGSKTDIRKHQILSRIFGDQGWHSKRATEKLVRELKEYKPDLIHLHNIHGYYLHMDTLFRYLRDADIPVVWTLHDCWAFTGHCTHYSAVQCNRRKTECRSCPQKKEYPYSLLLDRSRTLFKRKQKLYADIPKLRFTTVSDWLLKEASESKLLQGRKIETIRNGVDITTFRPSEESSDSNGKIILGVANSWSPKKGLGDFIRLRAILPAEYSIVLVGLTKEQIDSLPLGIKGIKRTDSVSDLAKLYRKAGVFFNPSIEETFGLTTAEALSSGTPVIGYDSTATPSLVTKETGYIVKPHDIEGVYEAVLEIFKNGKPFYEEKCRTHAKEMFDETVNYRNYILLYERIWQEEERKK